MQQYLAVEETGAVPYPYIEWSADAIAYALANELPITYYRIDLDSNLVPTLHRVESTDDLRR